MKTISLCVLIILLYLDLISALNFNTPKNMYPSEVCKIQQTEATPRRPNACQRLMKSSIVMQMFCHLFYFWRVLYKLWSQLYHVLETATDLMESKIMMIRTTQRPNFWKRLLQKGPLKIIDNARKKTRLLYYSLRIEHRVLMQIFNEVMKQNLTETDNAADVVDAEEQTEIEDLQESIVKTGKDLQKCVAQMKKISDDEDLTTLYMDVRKFQDNSYGKLSTKPMQKEKMKSDSASLH